MPCDIKAAVMDDEGRCKHCGLHTGAMAVDLGPGLICMAAHVLLFRVAPEAQTT